MKHMRLLLLITCILAFSPLEKFAFACGNCQGEVGSPFSSSWYKDQTIDPVNEYVTDSFEKHRDWIMTTWWDGLVLPAMRDMADELSAVAIHQAFIIGTFFDAKHQLETQQLLQKIRARANKDYHPSTGMCEFGSVAKSLAATERRSELNAFMLSQRSQARQLGASGSAAAPGDSADKRSRIEHFKKTYCDVNDNNGGLTLLCTYDDGGTTKIGAEEPERINKDIDFARTIDLPWTLEVDFSDGDSEASADEEDVFALAANLYGHDIARPPIGVLEDNPTLATTKKQRDYMKFRSLVAKRSVAENSFNAIVSKKASGTAGSKAYLYSIMEELGVDAAELGDILGENPSYHAQMEVLTKKMYQNPSFYTNLYDKPANINRKEVALQAIGLMQKFDLFKSHLRSEASLAVLLELAVEDLQGKQEKRDPQ